MTAIVDNMLARFLNLYGEPKTPNVAAFLAEYEAALGAYHPEAIRKAADKLIKTHTFKSWPTIAECREQIILATPIPPAKPIPDLPETVYSAEMTPEERSKAKKSRARVDAMVKECLANLSAVGSTMDRAPKFPATDRNAWNARREGRS